MGRENRRSSKLAAIGSGHPVLTSSFKVLEVLGGQHDVHVAFFDEFRILLARSCNYTDDASHLVVFDTRIPQNRPDSFLWLGFPSRYHQAHLNISFDCDRPLGTDTREGPFTVDPAQAVFAVVFTVGSMGPRTILAVRTNTLTGRTGPYIPWEEWGGGSVEIPLEEGNWTALVHGAHIAVPHIRRKLRLYTFDLSKWGCRALPRWSRESSVNERRLTLEDGREVSLKGARCTGMSPFNIGLLGDGIAVYPDSVSHLPRFSWNCAVY